MRLTSIPRQAKPYMGLSKLLPALASYVDIPFNAWLVIILIHTYVCAIQYPGLLLVVTLAASAVILVCDTTATLGEMAKTMCLLPLGLGSILAFLITNRSLKARLLPIFTVYVNFAVYGNIGMMIFAPGGGTLRGMCSKFACAALFLWIVQQGQRVGWMTIRPHDRLFVFTAVSKSWIFAHATYRFILLTLPCFGSGRRHRLLELFSLALTSALSSTFSLPFEHCFGMADTLVVPAIAGWSSIATTFNIIPSNVTKDDSLSYNIGTNGDVLLSAVSLVVATFALFKVASTPPVEVGKGF